MVSRKAVPEDFNLKYRSKFNPGFTNHGYLCCAIIKLSKSFIYDFKGKKWLQGIRSEFSSFKMFKMRFLKSWKCLKTTWNSPEQPVELALKLVTEKRMPHSWLSYVVTIAACYYVVITEGV